MVGAFGCYTTAASAHQAIVLRGCEASMGSAQLVRRADIGFLKAACRPCEMAVARGQAWT
jgi:hypothetical protein